MSFILDALKRAERDRRLEKAPDLSILYEEDPVHRRGPKTWIWVSLFFVLGIGLGFWGFSHRGSQQSDGTPTGKAAMPERSTAQATAVYKTTPAEARVPKGKPPLHGDSSSSARTDRAPNALKSPRSVKKPEMSTLPPPGAKAQRDDSKITTLGQKRPLEVEGAEPGQTDSAQNPKSTVAPMADPDVPADEPAFEQEAPPPEEEPPQADKSAPAQPVPLLSELPEETRDDLGRIEINVHVYSEDPQECRVFINMRNRKVGDRIGETGPILKEITPDGVIIDYGEGLARVKVGR
ncbi:MAG: general secretion pathway protein GspB [Desulfobacteraceae bacterium]